MVCMSLDESNPLNITFKYYNRGDFLLSGPFPMVGCFPRRMVEKKAVLAGNDAHPLLGCGSGFVHGLPLRVIILSIKSNVIHSHIVLHNLFQCHNKTSPLVLRQWIFAPSRLQRRTSNLSKQAVSQRPSSVLLPNMVELQ